jgi:hypothetical protein
VRTLGCLAGCLGDKTGFRGLSHEFSMGYIFRHTTSSKENRGVLSSGVWLEAASNPCDLVDVRSGTCHEKKKEVVIE